MDSKSEPIAFRTALLEVGKTINLKLISTEDPSRVAFLGNLGMALPKTEGKVSIQSESVEVNWNDSVFFTLTHHHLNGGHRYDIMWEVCEKAVGGLRDEVSLDNAHWYGAAQVRKQYWPIEQWRRGLEPYICGDSFVDEYGGVQERYWLSSRGVAVFVNKDMPLFVSINNRGNQKLTLVSKWNGPYNNFKNEGLRLSYSIYQGKNVQHTHMLVVGSAFPKPSDIPDETLFRYPIWSTWAKYKKNINQNIIINFAEELRKHQFSAAQIEIDDDWTPAYGDNDFDPKKFPDPKAMVEKLKEMGYRTTLWVHPFASPFSKAADLADFWVRAGVLPGYAIWWNGLGKNLDVTNPDAVKWFKESMEALRVKYGITSFKFDAGETNWLPAMPRTKKTLSSLNEYTTLYANMCAELDTETRCQEVRVGAHTQQLPVFVRMMDKDSRWDYDNGLKTLIPHALTFSLIGYPFILPDMIGGNAYKLERPDRELFIRWLQANVFLPSLQFSITPWQYDQEVIEICRRMVNLHEEYSDEMIRLARDCVQTGAPIIRPVWWIAPEDEDALTIDSQFLVGNDILVAPVLDKGARQRDVYLPAGKWRDMLNHTVLEGGKWHRKFDAQLQDLPFFIKVNEKENDGNVVTDIAEPNDTNVLDNATDEGEPNTIVGQEDSSNHMEETNEPDTNDGDEIKKIGQEEQDRLDDTDSNSRQEQGDNIVSTEKDVGIDLEEQATPNNSEVSEGMSAENVTEEENGVPKTEIDEQGQQTEENDSGEDANIDDNVTVEDDNNGNHNPKDLTDEGGNTENSDPENMTDKNEDNENNDTKNVLDEDGNTESNNSENVS